MLDDAIITTIDSVKTALDGAGVGTIYDTIPAKATLPCVIIAPAPTLVTEGETFNHRELNLDLFILATPSTDNRNLQQLLYKAIAKTITALEEVDALAFDEVTRPEPIELNQTKTLAATLTVNLTL